MSARRQNLDAAVAAWNDGDLDGYLGAYGDAMALHGYTPEPMDKTAVRGFYEPIFASSMPRPVSTRTRPRAAGRRHETAIRR